MVPGTGPATHPRPAELKAEWVCFCVSVCWVGLQPQPLFLVRAKVSSQRRAALQRGPLWCLYCDKWCLELPSKQPSSRNCHPAWVFGGNSYFFLALKSSFHFLFQLGQPYSNDFLHSLFWELYPSFPLILYPSFPLIFIDSSISSSLLTSSNL
jgi:hypothetical protein